MDDYAIAIEEVFVIMNNKFTVFIGRPINDTNHAIRKSVWEVVINNKARDQITIVGPVLVSGGPPKYTSLCYEGVYPDLDEVRNYPTVLKFLYYL